MEIEDLTDLELKSVLIRFHKRHPDFDLQRFYLNLIRGCPEHHKQQALLASQTGQEMIDFDAMFDSSPRKPLRDSMGKLKYSCRLFVQALVDDKHFRLSGSKNFHLYYIASGSCHYLFRCEFDGKDLVLIPNLRRKLKKNTYDISNQIWSDLAPMLSNICTITEVNANTIRLHKVESATGLLGLIKSIAEPHIIHH